MPKVRESGRVRSHRWRESVFVQLVTRYPRVARLILLVLLVSIGWRAWEIGSYLVEQRLRVKKIEQGWIRGESRFEEGVRLRDQLDRWADERVSLPDEAEQRMEAALRVLFEEERLEAEELLAEFSLMARRDLVRVQLVEAYMRLCGRQAEWDVLVGEGAGALVWMDRGEAWRNRLEVELSREQLELWSAHRSTVAGYGSVRVAVPGDVREIIIWPMIEDGSRRVPSDPLLRSTVYPVVRDSVRAGSYLIWAALPWGGYQSYPLLVKRNEDIEIELRLPGNVGAEWIFVPEGAFITGGSASGRVREHRVELPAFYISRTEVTVADYIAFWRSLENEGERHAYRAEVKNDQGDRLSIWNEGGDVVLEGWSLEHPVVGMTRAGAVAFCRWKSEQLGRVVRLPSALEWEKAARGVDGRDYVWGEGVEGAELFCNVGLPPKDFLASVERVGMRIRDASIYSARDMAGNVRELTASFSEADASLPLVKGGSAAVPVEWSACAAASGMELRANDVGFRLLMEEVR